MESFIEDRVPYARRIFCNRNLRLDRIQFIGFDMDYTLARYTEQIEHLQAEMVLDRMVMKYGYPREILQAKYDPGFAIRGLAVDLPNGNVFKMDRHRYVGRIWHGASPLDRELREQIYTNRKITPSDPRFVMVDTLFSLPEISLYCQLVDYFDGLEETTSRPTYEKLWVDLREAMDSLHRDDSLKNVIRSRLADFIIRDEELSETLHRFRSAGKKLFLLTNSEPDYTEAVMSFLFDGTSDSYPSWRDYFEFVLTSGRKPLFFQSDEPFSAVDNPIAEVKTLRRGHLYTGGSFLELARLTGMMGEDVLYVGDHIYGDILRSKIHTHWRTAMVVQEMERELDQLQRCRAEIDELASLEERRFQLNLELAARALDGDRAKKVRDEVKGITQEIAAAEKKNADSFNPYWGTLFRDRTELSAFGKQVENYACVYTSRVSNFRLYSPQWYFRSPRDRMAHELRF